MNKDLVERLVCPVTHIPLLLKDAKFLSDEVETGTLVTENGAKSYNIRGGIPILLPPEYQPPSQQHWLGSQPSNRFWPHLWTLTSNMCGVFAAPPMALFAWGMDLYMAARRLKAPFKVSDVRALLAWHMQFKRQYDHLRMLEHSAALGMLRETIKPGDDNWILDIGAEKSLFCSYLAKTGYRVIAMDLEEEQMHWQRNLYMKYKSRLKQPMDFVVGSATSIPFRDDATHVCSISTIEHIEDDQQAFSEIGRVIGANHRAIITLLYQDTELRLGQKEAAWKRAREHHPAYGTPRDIISHILAPSQCQITEELFFWKQLCRRAKKLVNITKVFNESMLFDYFVYLRLARLEEAKYPGKQANLFEGKRHPFHWVFKLQKV